MKKLLLLCLLCISLFSQVFPTRELVDTDLGTPLTNKTEGILSSSIGLFDTSFDVILNKESACLSPNTIITIESEKILTGTGTTCSHVSNAIRGYNTLSWNHNNRSIVNVDINGTYISKIDIELKNLANTLLPYWSNISTPYVLPISTNSVLGGIKIGAGLNTIPDGTVSVLVSTVSDTSITIGTACTESPIVLHINPLNGNIFICLGSVWTDMSLGTSTSAVTSVNTLSGAVVLSNGTTGLSPNWNLTVLNIPYASTTNVTAGLISNSDYLSRWYLQPTGTILEYIRGDGSLSTFPTNVSSFTNDANYLTTITSNMVTTALGYTPLDSSKLVLPYRAITTTYTISIQDFTINCTSGSYIVTLPTAIGITGQVYIIKNSGSGSITVNTTLSQLIDGNSNQSLSSKSSMMVQSTGTGWIIL